MSFRANNQKFYLPGAQIVMLMGIGFLCQPWVEVLHRYGLTITLFGLIGFIVTVHIDPPAEIAEEDDI